MPAVISARDVLSALSLEQWILRLDRYLRHRYGIYEYSTAERCILRAERCRADQAVQLADGVRVRVGDPLLRLHLWNERIPPMGPRGPSIAWARRIERDLAISLRELARHLARDAGAGPIVAVCAHVHLASERQRLQVARIFGRFDFQTVSSERNSLLRDLGESLLVALLMLATNPVSLRNGLLRRGCERVMISRAQLLRRYSAPSRARSWRAVRVHEGEGVRPPRSVRPGSVVRPAAARASAREADAEEISAHSVL